LKAFVQAGVLVNAGYFPNLDALAPVFLSLGFALLVEEMILGQYEQRMDSQFPSVIASGGDETVALLAAEQLQPWSVE
jgi:hypothetical protein